MQDESGACVSLASFALLRKAGGLRHSNIGALESAAPWLLLLLSRFI
jgi:hypothetical protein